MFDCTVETLCKWQEYMRRHKTRIIRERKGDRLGEQGPPHMQGRRELLLVGTRSIAKVANDLSFRSMDDKGEREVDNLLGEEHSPLEPL